MGKKSLTYTYVVIGRLVGRANVKLCDDGFIRIRIRPSTLKTTRHIKASLSASEIRTIISEVKPKELVISVGAIKDILVTTLRRDRKDIAELYKDFENEIKGNIYEVVVTLEKGDSIKLLLPQSDYLRLRNYLKRYGLLSTYE